MVKKKGKKEFLPFKAFLLKVGASNDLSCTHLVKGGQYIYVKEPYN